MKHSEKSTGYTIGSILVVAMSLPLLCILNGYVLSVPWGWFVISLFSDMPRLSISAAIGLSIVVRFITNHQGEDKREWYVILSSGFLYPLVVLLAGEIVHQYMLP